MRKILFLFVGFSLFSQLGVAQETRFVSQKVAEGLYVLHGEGGFTGGNIAISVGDDGVIMIDDSMPPFLDQLKKHIASLAGGPVDFLINTHMHGDHTGNNASLGAEGAHIVGHKNLRKRLKVAKHDTPDGKKPTPTSALPVITFSSEITFHLNGIETRVFHVANAHTDGDAVIHFKDINVIHTGDILFSGMFPYIDMGKGGTVSGYIAAQKKIYEVADDNTVIIPGHGPVGTRQALKDSFTMLEEVRTIIRELVKQGKSEDEVVALNPLKDYHDKWNWGFITTEKITRTVYQDLSK